MELKDLISRIKKHLASEDAHFLLYAALDCRLAIEQIISEKLTFHARRHSEKLLFKKWQPHLAFEILAQLEPDIDKTIDVYAINESDANNKKIKLGTQVGIKPRWLKKKFHSLGSYAHLNNTPNKDKLVKLINECLAEIEKHAENKFQINLAEVTKVPCPNCNTKIVVNTASIPALTQVHCPNPDCNSIFPILQSETDKKHFHLLPSRSEKFQCISCESEGYLPKDDLTKGYKFACDSCGEEYKILEQNWSFTLITPPTALDSTEPSQSDHQQ